jgi:formylglycine-generating enzyme required for sulfatase activity
LDDNAAVCGDSWGTVDISTLKPFENCLSGMAGNVSEWVFGEYADASAVPDKGVVRGGSWLTPRQNARTSFRHFVDPESLDEGDQIGFRCAYAKK